MDIISIIILLAFFFFFVVVWRIRYESIRQRKVLESIESMMLNEKKKKDAEAGESLLLKTQNIKPKNVMA